MLFRSVDTYGAYWTGPYQAKKEGTSYDAYRICFVYPENPGFNVCGCIPRVGYHVGDIESLIFLVHPKTKSLCWIYFSAHAGFEGTWCTANECITSQGVLRAYVSAESHALYPTKGTHWRGFGLLNDHCAESERTSVLWNVPLLAIPPPESGMAKNVVPPEQTMTKLQRFFSTHYIVRWVRSVIKPN